SPRCECSSSATPTFRRTPAPSRSEHGPPSVPEDLEDSFTRLRIRTDLEPRPADLPPVLGLDRHPPVAWRPVLLVGVAAEALLAAADDPQRNRVALGPCAAGGFPLRPADAHLVPEVVRGEDAAEDEDPVPRAGKEHRLVLAPGRGPAPPGKAAELEL